MTTKTAPRRISSVRYVARTGAKGSSMSPLAGLALLTAVAIAVTLLTVTISAASALS